MLCVLFAEWFRCRWKVGVDGKVGVGSVSHASKHFATATDHPPAPHFALFAQIKSESSPKTFPQKGKGGVSQVGKPDY